MTQPAHEREGASPLSPRCSIRRGSRDLVLRPLCLDLSLRARSATAGHGQRHHRSHIGQRVARRTARRASTCTPTALVAVAVHVALTAVARFGGPAARAARSTPASGSARLGVPARGNVRSVGFLRIAAHRRRRRRAVRRLRLHVALLAALRLPRCSARRERHKHAAHPSPRLSRIRRHPRRERGRRGGAAAGQWQRRRQQRQRAYARYAAARAPCRHCCVGVRGHPVPTDRADRRPARRRRSAHR